MIIEPIYAVLDEGERQRGNNVPADPRRRLVIYLGTDVTMRFYVLHRSGAEVELTTGSSTLVFTLRDRPGEFGDKKFQATATLRADLGPHIADVSIAPQISKQWDGERNLARWFWDLALTRNGRRDLVVPTSPFCIIGAVGLP